MGLISAGGVVNENAHPPIVTLAEFEAAPHASGHSVVRSTTPALLAGILRCESCRHAMKPKTVTGTTTRVYRCARTHATGVCPAPASIYATVAEPYAERLLLDVAAATRPLRLEQLTREIDQAEREVEAERAELHAFAADQGLLALGRELFVAGLEARQERLADAEARRRDLFAEDATALPPVARVGELWPTLTTAERRRVLERAFAAIVVRPLGRVPVEQRMIPIYSGDAPADLPGRGRRVPFGPFRLPPGARVRSARIAQTASSTPRKAAVGIV